MGLQSSKKYSGTTQGKELVYKVYCFPHIAPPWALGLDYGMPRSQLLLRRFPPSAETETGEGMRLGVEIANLPLQSVWEAARYQGDWISRLLSMQAACLQGPCLVSSDFPQFGREQVQGAVGEGQRKVTGATALGRGWGRGAHFVASTPSQGRQLSTEKGLRLEALGSGPRAA